MPTSTKVPVAQQPEGGVPESKEDALERELDDALADTFPASDPIAVTPLPDDDTAMDSALDDTFPASDPSAITQPKRH